MGEYRFINCDNCTTLMQDTTIGETGVGTLYTIFTTFCKYETVLKFKTSLKKSGTAVKVVEW